MLHLGKVGGTVNMMSTEVLLDVWFVLLRCVGSLGLYHQCGRRVRLYLFQRRSRGVHVTPTHTEGSL